MPPKRSSKARRELGASRPPLGDSLVSLEETWENVSFHFADPLKSSGSAIALKPPASINIVAYPHLLSLIIDNSSKAPLATLLRCSKSMFKAVSPALYRTLRVTHSQLSALIETGWAPARKTTTSLARSFSPFARECLQQVRNLHLLNFDEASQYPDVPRGVFANNQNIVLVHSDNRPYREYLTLPTSFHSLGGTSLYIRVTEAQVRDNSGGRISCEINHLPRSFKSVVLIVPLACRLEAAPTCGFQTRKKIKTCDTTVVLLPWRITAEETARHSYMREHWPQRAARHVPETLDYHSTFIGFNFAGPMAEETSLLGWAEPSNRDPTYIDFYECFETLKAGEIFGEAELDWLWVAHIRLKHALNLESLDMLEAEIDRRCAEGENPSSQATISMRRAVALIRGNAPADLLAHSIYDGPHKPLDLVGWD